MFVHKFSVSIHKFQESHVWWEDGDAGVKGMLELVLLRCKPLGCSPLIFPHLLGVPLFFHVCLPPFNYYTDPVSNLVSHWVFFCKVCSTAFFVAQCTGELLLVALWQWISQSTVLSRETCPSQVLMKAVLYPVLLHSSSFGAVLQRFPRQWHTCCLDEKNEEEPLKRDFLSEHQTEKGNIFSVKLHLNVLSNGFWFLLLLDICFPPMFPGSHFSGSLLV